MELSLSHEKLAKILLEKRISEDDLVQFFMACFWLTTYDMNPNLQISLLDKANTFISLSKFGELHPDDPKYFNDFRPVIALCEESCSEIHNKYVEFTNIIKDKDLSPTDKAVKSSSLH